MKITDLQLDIKFEMYTKNQWICMIWNKVAKYKELHPSLTVLEVSSSFYKKIVKEMIDDLKSNKHIFLNFDDLGDPECYGVTIIEHNDEEDKFWVKILRKQKDWLERTVLKIKSDKEKLERERDMYKNLYLHFEKELSLQKDEFVKVCFKNKKLQEKVEMLDRIAWECKDRWDQYKALYYKEKENKKIVFRI